MFSVFAQYKATKYSFFNRVLFKYIYASPKMLPTISKFTFPQGIHHACVRRKCGTIGVSTFCQQHLTLFLDVFQILHF